MTEPIALVKTIAAVLDEKKAEDIVAIKTEEVTIVSDYFVLASGTSSTHTRALADEVDVFMPDEKARRLGQSVAAAQIPVVKK